MWHEAIVFVWYSCLHVAALLTVTMYYSHAIKFNRCVKLSQIGVELSFYEKVEWHMLFFVSMFFM